MATDEYADLDLHVLSPHLRNPEAAIAYLERLRWPDGPVCPHCGESQRKHYHLKTPKHAEP
jgi:hypothetical protein